MFLIGPLVMAKGDGRASFLLKRPGQTIFPALWMLSAMVLAAYGQATVIGKKHEQAS
jgi:hypothetical protein